MVTTLNHDAFKDEPMREPARPTGVHHIVYGSRSYVDDLDAHTIGALELVGVISFVREIRYPGGATRLYVSELGKVPTKE